MKVGVFKDIWFGLSLDLQDFQRRVVDPVCQKNGLTGQQLRILLALADRPDQSVGDLSENVAILRTNIAAVCGKLERDGLIQRVRSGSDKRIVSVCLTARGAGVLDGVRSDFNQRYAHVFENEPQETFEAVSKGMAALQSFLKKF